jgi:riboflavin-specific deaminase-like protein
MNASFFGGSYGSRRGARLSTVLAPALTPEERPRTVEAVSAFIEPPRRINPVLRLGARLASRLAGRPLMAPLLLSWYPRTAVGSGALEAFAAHPDRGIDRRLLKLVRMRVSFTVSCPFCIDMNSFGYQALGISDEEAEALRGARPLESVASFSRRERAAIAYATLASASPLSFPEGFVRELRECFSERQIVVLASAAAQVNYWARLLQALGVPPAGFNETCPVPAGPRPGTSAAPAAAPLVSAPRILDLARAALAERRASGGRPIVTLAWAQSLNGAIARRRGEPTGLSGPESLALTHSLRSLHDGILVGIGTVLADDPLLSVRLVSGPQPRPIVLDSRLRTPPASRLLGRTDVKPWIFYSGEPSGSAEALRRAGARLLRVRHTPSGLDLGEVLDTLIHEGVGSVMVEGGAAVLQGFLVAGVARHAAITVSPGLMEGLAVIEQGAGLPEGLALRDPVYEVFGRDMVIWGELGR